MAWSWTSHSCSSSAVWRRFPDFGKVANAHLRTLPLPTSTTTAGFSFSCVASNFTANRAAATAAIFNCSSNKSVRRRGRRRRSRAAESNTELELELDEESNPPSSSPPPPPPPSATTVVDCVATGLEVECLVSSTPEEEQKSDDFDKLFLGLSSWSAWWEWTVLVSPFFFWGTAMVAMKQVLPKAGPFFVGAFRLIPAGLLLIAFAAFQRRKLPSGLMAWVSISLFALVDAACFQGFLAEGLQKTSAGLGSVIIDSQPLTVAVLAALLFGESIGFVGVFGLVLGVIGLLLLEVPALALDANNFSLWGSGESWMFLAAQSMAVGTVMVRWVCKYSDPVMATGWHMIIGGFPLVALSFINHDRVLSGSFNELTVGDISALFYTSIFGSAVSYGVYFYNATRGSLTKLSSLTFLTPMFASIFGFLYLGETFSSLQVVGASVTLVAIYMVNYENNTK